MPEDAAADGGGTSPSWLLDEEFVRQRVTEVEGRFRSVRFQSIGIISGWFKAGEKVLFKDRLCTIDTCLYTVKDDETLKRFGLSGEIMFLDGSTLRERAYHPHNNTLLNKFVHYRRRPHRDYIISAHKLEVIPEEHSPIYGTNSPWLLNAAVVNANATKHAGESRNTRYQAIALVSGWLKAGDRVTRKGQLCTVSACLSRVVEVVSHKEYALSGEVLLPNGGSIKDRYSLPHNLEVLKAVVHDTGRARNRYMVHHDARQVPRRDVGPRSKRSKIAEIEQLETQLGLRETQGLGGGVPEALAQLHQMQQQQSDVTLDMLHGGFNQPLINLSMAPGLSSAVNLSEASGNGASSTAPAFLPIHIPSSHVVTLPWSQQALAMPAVHANDFATS